MLRAEPPRAPHGAGDPGLVACADAVARRIVRDAIWAGDRCTWMVWSSELFGGAWRVIYRTAPPDLYDGLAGIALFLTHLVQYTGDADQRAVRDGALRQLVRCADDARPEPSAYTGALSAGWALARIGESLGDDALVEAGIAFMERALRTPFAPGANDVQSGRAGAIAALLDLAQRFARSDLADVARRCGDEVVAAAEHDGDAASWSLAPGLTTRNLLGFSHGAGGIAWALLELAHATADARYAVTAQAALRYERRWYSPEHGSWPDFRANLPPGTPTHPLVWCHGGAGIGLSRLRILELLPDDAEVRAEIDAAVASVRAMVAAQLRDGCTDQTYCHGMAGGFELLASYAERFDDGELRAFVASTARALTERYPRTRTPWPCGVMDAGETPSMMTGTAGIGYAFLRAHDPAAVPPVLVMAPQR